MSAATKHGTAEWYDQGCNCDACVDAAWARVRAAVKATGARTGKWNSEELALIQDARLLAREVAVKTGRRVSAIYMMRRNLGVPNNSQWAEKQRRIRTYLDNPPPTE